MPISIARRCSALMMMSLFATGAVASVLSVQVQDSSGKALQNATVYAESVNGAALPKRLHPAEIEQRNFQFAPLVTIIQTGSRVSFPNFDKVRHHIYSFSGPHKFDQKLYSGASAIPQTFDKPGLVILGCNIHDKMIAYVKVVDTPYYGKTDATGAVKIDLPAGQYILKAWHYQDLGGLTSEQPIAVKADASSAVFKLALKPVSDEDAAGANDSGY